MGAVEIIARKRDGERLKRGELEAFAEAAASGGWPEYQLAALLMAIAVRGLDADETAWLTGAMLATGTRLQWPKSERPLVDKHSTGGVGDKLSLVVAPLVAACGAGVPMLSGRGLAHTGGTLDKLEAIPGFRVDLSVGEIQEIVASVGCVICGATEEMVPADRVLYALRDETATVASVPLICASILSKKLAEGIGGLVLDVKCGSGGVMDDRESAEELGRALVDCGTAAGLPTEAVLTRMDVPLGASIGNAVEVVEAIEVLGGGGPADVRGLSLELSGRMLCLAGIAASAEEGRRRAETALDAGAGLETFGRMVAAQGGEQRIVEDLSLLPSAELTSRVTAVSDGWLAGLDAGMLGRACLALRPGRLGKGVAIDPAAGIRVVVMPGQELRAGDVVLEVMGEETSRVEEAVRIATNAVRIEQSPGVPGPLLLCTIEADATGE